VTSEGGYWLQTYEGSELAERDAKLIEEGVVIPLNTSFDLLMEDAPLDVMEFTTKSIGSRNGNCVYRTRGDDPHRSGDEVSVHGWWLRDSDNCPSRADVTVYLQAAWCQDPYGCHWTTLNSDSQRKRPGGGRGRRVTVRDSCFTYEWTYFRNVVDVDIPGERDPGDQVTKVKQVQCSPPGPRYR